MGDQGLPVVQKGQPLEEWLALAVPALMEQHQLDEQTATQLATDAWNKVNGDGGDASGADQGTDASAYGQAGPGDQPDQTPAAQAPKGKTPPPDGKTPPAAADGKAPKGKAPPFGAKPAGDAPAGDAAGGQTPKGKAPPFGAKPAAQGQAPGAKPADPAAQMTGQAPKGAGAPTAKPKGPTIPAADGKPLAPAATPGMNGQGMMNGQPGMMNGQGQNGQKPQGMNWDNPDSWGSGLDEAGGMGHMMGGEEDHGGSGRPALDLGQVHDSFQLLENWVVANIAAYASALVAALTATGRATDEQAADLGKSIVKTLEVLTPLELDETGHFIKGGKAATLPTLLEASIHQNFTDLADSLRRDGHLTRAERIALSGCIGDALDTFNVSLATKLSPGVTSRSPWSDVEQATDQFEFVTPLPPVSVFAALPDATVPEPTPARLPAQLKSADFEALRAAWLAREGFEGYPTLKSTLLAVPDNAADYLTVKSLSPSRVGSYLCLWGSPQEADIAGEWFSKNTQELTAVFDGVGAIPAIYHHAIDDTLKSLVIGAVDTMKADDVGLWIEAQIKRRREYEKFIRPLIEQKALGWSSGTLPMARRVNKATGEILRWPIVEASLTPQPAEMRMAHQWPIRNLKAAYTQAGLPIDILEQLTQGGAPNHAHEIALELERLALLAV